MEALSLIANVQSSKVSSKFVVVDRRDKKPCWCLSSDIASVLQKCPSLQLAYLSHQKDVHSVNRFSTSVHLGHGQVISSYLRTTYSCCDLTAHELFSVQH